jgi:uncharacterized membrane protein YjgN (DUF898 family)
MATESTARLALAPDFARTGGATRLQSELDLGEVWPSFLVWLVVSVCTLGLGWIVVSGHFFRLILNSTIIVDGTGRRLGRLRCDYDVEGQMGQVVTWVLLSIVTLGVGLLFYSFHAARRAIAATSLEWEV